jgi:RHS repeat-associated protein
VRQLATDTGNVNLTQTYNPFGDLNSTTGLDNTAYGFAGEWTDNTGLQYLRARYYAPTQGRFLTRDTWQGTYTRPASLHRYTYAENNPVLYTDPSGHCVPACILVGGAILFAVALWIAIPYYDDMGDAMADLVDDVVDTCDSLVDQLFRTVGRVVVADKPEFNPTVTPVGPVGYNPTPNPTPEPTPDRFVRVRHYSQNIMGIMASMAIKVGPSGPYTWVEYPITTSYDEDDIQNTTKEFMRPLNGRGGFVEFSVDLNRWTILPDNNLPYVSNAKMIPLYTHDGVVYVDKGFPLSEPGTNPRFFDWQGNLLR